MTVTQEQVFGQTSNRKERLTLKAYVQHHHCDAMGHMNVRHYLGFFDDAIMNMFSVLGLTSIESVGWADAQHVLNYRQEVLASTPILIESSFLRLGNSSVTTRHVMKHATDGVVAATAETVTVCFNLEERAKMPIPDGFRSRVESAGLVIRT